MIIGMVTLLIVSVTLYLIIKATVIRRKKELGIQKAIGYTNKQLMFQMALSFLPVLLIGMLAGSIFGYFEVNPLLSIVFSSIGIMQIHLPVPILLLVGIGVVVIILGFIISLLVAR